jgi:glycine/D-amino acid oxidase-like deaminating enzyme
MRVVICGGGVIGCCTAYFLARRGIEVIVVEGNEVAAAASGKAGGFLALDWCAGTPLDTLARRSFGLHAALSNEIAGDWGYRRMTAYSGSVVPGRHGRRHERAELPWLSNGVIIDSRLSTTETTAIVHPRALPPPCGVQRRGMALNCGEVGSPASFATRQARPSEVSRSMAASSRRMRSSSRWGRGR